MVEKSTFAQVVSHVWFVKQACIDTFSGGYQISDGPLPLQLINPIVVVPRSPEVGHGTLANRD